MKEFLKELNIFKIEFLFFTIAILTIFFTFSKIIFEDSNFNIEKKLNENYIKVTSSSQLNKNLIVIYVDNLFYYIGKRPNDRILVFTNESDSLNHIKEIKIDSLDMAGLVLIKNNWYINKNELLKKSKKEIIENCMKLEEIVLDSLNKGSENIKFWSKN